MGGGRACGRQVGGAETAVGQKLLGPGSRGTEAAKGIISRDTSTEAGGQMMGARGLPALPSFLPHTSLLLFSNLRLTSDN